jgi:hypothetical protein
MNTTKKEKDKPILRIFLSHTPADNAHARKLRNLLSHRLNLRVFTTGTLSAGEDWRSKLKDELFQCDIFMVLLSPNSVESPWVLQELGAAWGLNKPIIPVITNPEVLTKIPVALSKVQSVDINNIENPEAINQILERYEEEVATSHNN